MIHSPMRHARSNQAQKLSYCAGYGLRVSEAVEASASRRKLTARAEKALQDGGGFLEPWTECGRRDAHVGSVTGSVAASGCTAFCLACWLRNNAEANVVSEPGNTALKRSVRVHLRTRGKGQRAGLTSMK